MDELGGEFWACLALRHTKGLGARTWKRLVDDFGSAANAVSAFPHWPHVSKKVCAEFATGAWKAPAEQEATQAHKHGLTVLPLADPEFPELLRHIPDPPLFLYVLGDQSLLHRPCVAMVGSRQSSQYGLQMADSIARTLSQSGVCVVSGFAFGIDRAAHWGAVRGVGSTIAVLGTGIDLIYPFSNRDLWTEIADKGLIISEFAPGTKPEGINFPHRNRIVSGLSLGVLVVEGALKSGSLITAELALAQNRDVFALPGPANLKTFQGCHQLIRQGAYLIQDGNDILRELTPRLRSCAHAASQPDQQHVQAEPDLDDPDQRVLFALLRTKKSMHIDEMARTLDWPAEQVSATLLFLELQGLVKQLPGMYYTCGVEYLT
ncbi:hypothetical protein MASR1M90_08980 [Desulfovibrionales bacterium]